MVTPRPWLAGLAAALLVIEVTPLNELLRLSSLGMAHATWGTPLAGAISYGLATLAVEGAAAMATAWLLSTSPAASALDRVSLRLSRLFDAGQPVSPVVLGGLALLGGSAIALVAANTQRSPRTYESNRRLGYYLSLSLALVCAAQGALIAQGVRYPSPATIGAAILLVGGLYTFALRVRRPPCSRRLQ